MNFSELFIRRPVMTTVLTVSVIFFGILGYLRLPVNDLPAVDYPVIQVQVSYPGASPDTVANAIATPLERQFMQINGLELITSKSSQGNASMTLQFALDKNIDGADYAAQFMTVTFDCTERMKRECPAAVHVDGTARPQLVTSTSNPSFHRIISEYHRLTGIPSVINTSFNMHEEPIVCTPDDAIRAFLQGNLDYLAIGNFLVAHPGHRR